MTCASRLRTRASSRLLVFDSANRVLLFRFAYATGAQVYPENLPALLP